MSQKLYQYVLKQTKSGYHNFKVMLGGCRLFNCFTFQVATYCIYHTRHEHSTKQENKNLFYIVKY